ncbi:MAG: GntR family transcriptional regulator [Adlercreutzia sp.]|nr:GntR family transcriptional regulator [Adlercreutzia sp.]
MEIFEKDETNRAPLWVQLRNRLIHLITSGYFKAGDQLPSVRALALDAGINYNTVYKVYRSLERDGYISNLRGSGSYVNDVSNRPHGVGASSTEALVEDFVQKCLDMGMTYEEIPVAVMQGVMKVRTDRND